MPAGGGRKLTILSVNAPATFHNRSYGNLVF